MKIVVACFLLSILTLSSASAFPFKSTEDRHEYPTSNGSNKVSTLLQALVGTENDEDTEDVDEYKDVIATLQGVLKSLIHIESDQDNQGHDNTVQKFDTLKDNEEMEEEKAQVLAELQTILKNTEAMVTQDVSLLDKDVDATAERRRSRGKCRGKCRGWWRRSRQCRRRKWINILRRAKLIYESKVPVNFA